MRLALALLLGAVLADASDLIPLDEAAYRRMVASHKGKVVLVNFWATYCVPCRKEMPALVDMHRRLQSRGLVFVTVSADEPEDVGKARQLLEQMQAPAPHYVTKVPNSEAFINAVEPKWSGALPASFLYDRSGRKVRSWIGEANMKELEAAVSRLLGTR